MNYYKNCEEVTPDEHKVLMNTLYKQGYEDKDAYLIHNSRLFSGTTMNEFESMIGCLTPEVKTYSEGDMILRSGDRVETVALVLKGTAVVEQEDFWGKVNEIKRLECPQTFGIAYACTPTAVVDVNVVAATDAKVIFFDIKRILTVCSMGCEHHSRIVRNVVHELALSNLEMQNKINHISQKTTRKKLLCFFSTEAKKAGSAEFEIAFSRQELADYLGIDRSGLSVEISKLQDDGIIKADKNHFALIV